jgi:hypothetical protein
MEWARIPGHRIWFPGVQRCFADPVRPTQLDGFHPSFVFLQDRNDLFFRMPLSFHRPVPANGQNSNSTWINSWGKISGIRYEKFCGYA